MHTPAPFSWLPSGVRPLMVHLPWIALAILLGVQSVIGAMAARSYQLAASEYLPTARRCVEHGDCPSKGGPVAGVELFHGASWIRLLSYSLRAGNDQSRAQFIVLGLLILSVALTFVLVHRYLGLRAATIALGISVPVVLGGTEFQTLTYVNLCAFPLALYYASMAGFVEFRKLVFASVASIALAAAASADLVCILMLPFHVLLIALTAPRPIVALTASGLAFAIPFFWESTDAAVAMVQQLPTTPFAVGFAIMGGAVALAVRMSPQMRLPDSMSTPQRVRAVMVAALIYTTTTVLLVDVLVSHELPQPRFFTLSMFPFLFLVAEPMVRLGWRTTLAFAALESLALLLLPFAPHAGPLLQGLTAIIGGGYAVEVLARQISWRGAGLLPARALWPTAAVCLCVIAIAVWDIVMVSNRGPRQGVALAEGERLVTKLYSAGYSYSELLGSLQGPAADDLLPLLADYDPNLFTEPSRPLSNENFSLLVVRVPNAAMSRASGVIAAVPVDASMSAIVVRSERSYLDWIHMRQCSWTTYSGRPASYDCRQPRTDQPLSHGRPWVELSNASSLSNVGVPAPAPDRSIHFEVPVHTPGRGMPRIVRATSEWPSTWRIARVSGVEFEGELPGVELRLPDRREADGVMEFEYTAGLPGDEPWVWVPHVMEVTQDNEPLLEPFRSAR